MQQTPTDEQLREAESWALKNHIKVYPVLANTSYDVRGVRNKKTTLSHVNLAIQLNNAVHVGKMTYKQDEEMREKQLEIYWHYYNKSNN